MRALAIADPLPAITGDGPRREPHRRLLLVRRPGGGHGCAPPSLHSPPRAFPPAHLLTRRRHPAYFAYKISRIFNPDSSERYAAARATLTIFSVLCLVMLLATFVLMGLCMLNFDKGLKERSASLSPLVVRPPLACTPARAPPADTADRSPRRRATQSPATPSAARPSSHPLRAAANAPPPPPRRRPASRRSRLTSGTARRRRRRRPRRAEAGRARCRSGARRACRSIEERRGGPRVLLLGPFLSRRRGSAVSSLTCQSCSIPCIALRA